MSAEYEPGHRRPEGADLPEPEPPPEPRRRRPRDGRRSDGAGGSDGGDSSRMVWLIAGAAAIAGGTALGWNPSALDSVVNPPLLIRAALVGGSAALGVVLLLSAVARLAGDPAADGLPRGHLDRERDIAGMIRGVRLVFLAVAAFAAASGWLLGHSLPLVVALVIAGVDVLETSFLLIVVALRSPD